MKTKEYIVTAIIDIIKNVPTDRVEDCMKELTALILHSKISYDLTIILDPNATAKLPNTLIWKDDGRGNIKVTHHVNDQEFMVSKEKLEPTSK